MSEDTIALELRAASNLELLLDFVLYVCIVLFNLEQLAHTYAMLFPAATWQRRSEQSGHP